MTLFKLKKIENRILEIKKILNDQKRQKDMAQEATSRGITKENFLRTLRQVNKPMEDELEELQARRVFVHDDRNLMVNIITIIVALFIAFAVPSWEISLQQKAEEKSDIQSLYQTLIANEDIFISNFNEIRYAQNNNLPISVPEQYIEFPIKENVHKTLQREFGIDGYRFLLYFLNQTNFLNQKTLQIKDAMIKNGILMSKDSRVKDYQTIMSSLEDGNWESSKLNYIYDTSCLLYFFQKSFSYIEIADREKTMTCSSDSLNRLFYHFGDIEAPKWLIPELRKALNERESGLGDRLIQEVK